MRKKKLIFLALFIPTVLSVVIIYLVSSNNSNVGQAFISKTAKEIRGNYPKETKPVKLEGLKIRVNKVNHCDTKHCIDLDVALVDAKFELKPIYGFILNSEFQFIDQQMRSGPVVVHFREMGLTSFMSVEAAKYLENISVNPKLLSSRLKGR